LKGNFVNGLYQKLLALDATELEKIIDNDHIATRSTLMEANTTKHKSYFTADQQKLKNIIRAYGQIDPEVGYSQGYNYIIALLLRFIPNEESCFWCFIKIMTDMNWRRFFIVSDPTMATLQADMPEFL
jgi:hypothetical protein